MKGSRLALLAPIIILFVGCAGTPINISKISLGQNESKVAGVGDVFFSKEQMKGEDNGFGSVFNGDAFKFDLTVVSATSSKIALEYNEYIKPLAGQYGGYRKDGAWLIRDKFTKKLEYEITESENEISYKSYKFKIIKVNGGQIEYLRIQ